RIHGMGETTSHYFRDKLAMRERCWDRGIPAPEFVHVLNNDRIARFLEKVPPPWLIKPRNAANSFGIKKFTEPGPLWEAIEQFGDERSGYVLEHYLPGDVCHVDGIIYNDEVVFAQPHKYRRPLMDVAQGG